MEIIISNSSDKPIYEQIAMQIKSLIMNGTLSAGEALPSMRALAKDLHISVITVQRAYEDLTRDGFIETVSGKGSFVASPNKEFILAQNTLSCVNMKYTKLEDVYNVLNNEENEIFVDEKVSKEALKALDKMMELSK